MKEILEKLNSIDCKWQASKLAGRLCRGSFFSNNAGLGVCCQHIN